MRILKDVGLVKALLLVGALVAANLYVGDSASRLEAQLPGGGYYCFGFQGHPTSHCEAYPSMYCVEYDCNGATLEP